MTSSRSPARGPSSAWATCNITAGTRKATMTTMTKTEAIRSVHDHPPYRAALAKLNEVQVKADELRRQIKEHEGQEGFVPDEHEGLDTAARALLAGKPIPATIP